MSDTVWYGRLAVWVGALVLLLQSVTGRSEHPVTLVAVVLLSLGFAVFIAGLASDGRILEMPDGASKTTPEETEPPPAAAAPWGESTAVAEPQRTTAEALPIPATPIAELHESPRAAPRSGRVETFEVGASTGQLAAQCPRCASKVEPGQIAAVCLVCGSIHHASCWTENRFSCAVPGCTGRGGLEAPRENEIPVDVDRKST